jgi:hypothetical protein
MQLAHHGITIHHFDKDSPPYFDEEGDQMMDYYYQFTDKDDQPCSALVGPYRYRKQAEIAARHNFGKKDF